jgi:hypothetical protein
VRLVTAVLGLVLLAPAAAMAASCRDYGREIQALIKQPVELLRRTEREAADRIAGLDTRPFEYLLAQARAALAIVADKNGLAEEDALSRCRNYIPPVRRTCAAAGEALVAVIEQQAAGAASNAAKATYAGVMPQCERFMGLAPLNTALRTSE